MINEFLQVFSNIRSKQHFYADDRIDKINRSLTVIFLIISSIIVGTRQWIGPAIICLDDAHRLQAITLDYVQHVCWAKNTYHLYDLNNVNSEKTDVTYYQWLPFILMFLAFCFYLPYLVWKLLINFCNIDSLYVPPDISGILNLLKETKISKTKDFNSAIAQTVEYLHHCFIRNSVEYRNAYKSGSLDYDFDTGIINTIKMNESTNRSMRRNNLCCLDPIYGLYKRQMFLKYFLVKILYLVNSVAVFWFLNIFLSLKSGYHFFGIDFFKIIYSANSSNTFWNSKHFPRVVYCDLEVKGDWVNLQRLRFQCSLPANVFNEKVFLFLWAWFAIVAILNFFSLIKWIFASFNRFHIVRKYVSLNAANSIIHSSNANEKTDMRRLYNLFLNSYLQFDGYFLLLIVQANLNDLYTRRLIESLFKSYVIQNLDDDDIMTPIKSYSAASTAKVPRDMNSASPNYLPTNRKYLYQSAEHNIPESKLLDKNNDEKLIRGKGYNQGDLV